MALWSNTNVFASLSGNQPASKLDTNFSELSIISVYASAVGGTANDIALTAPLTLSSGLRLGVRIAFIAASTNTSAMTASVNGSANPAIQKGTLALAPGDVKAGGFYELYHDGAVWQLMTPTQTSYLVAVNTLAAAATSDFTSSSITSAFTKYRMDIIDLRMSASPVNLLARVSQAAAFRSGASDYQWANNRSTAAATGATEGSTADTSMQLAVSASNGTTNGVVRTINGEVMLYNPAGSFLKQLKWSLSFLNNTGTLQNVQGSGAYVGVTSGTPATAVDGVRLLSSSGTLTGTVVLYGVRGS